MPISEFDPDSLIAKVNKEPCLVNFLDTPITYKHFNLDVTIDYYSGNDLPPHLRDWTFNLVKSNLYDMYNNSKEGWSDEGKKREMLAPEARYLIARSSADPNDLKGFLLFQMVQEETMDDDVMANCAYCYEIQLTTDARNQGLGEFLMNLLSCIGSYWKMDKVMLTVFKANKDAFRFYVEKLGFKLDEISPGACLPKYKAKLFDYELLSKPC
ncbi:hypothetical protein G6F46_000007 [Rhizopus delemar]|nr:hypothetical protein G6F55_000910 [Rhizopus delemar]KAG1551524.1 hypothetical protein G6F51_001787 [Rhizopus arrhizus]KAG1505386.1 hypothetical protein G6F54_000348 [Rhizopus delemar]KAG1519141.1 hypothetical protein G6F53_000021 [Rhizopus delemar]KAG1527916.1 hypothetical protein G6F52_001113 [Rhizopus delemar]